ncbi:putative transmembrane reductase CYB561D1 isoform X1 [Ranitomeya variabilis]|uniref:putative transmembrane reductase CYB561D1 isoform X1 n=1 Tax=Ranitomeya variabilis TaxID=490064 RepID=UPI0040578FFA
MKLGMVPGHCEAHGGTGIQQLTCYIRGPLGGAVVAGTLCLSLTQKAGNVTSRKLCPRSLHIRLLSVPEPGTVRGLFSWHPVFMAAAYCLCMTEAVLLLSPETSPFCPLSRKSKTRLHWLIQLCVPVFAGVGIAFIIWSKNRSELSHLTSWHSLLGGLTLITTCCQAVCGLALLFPRLARVTAVSRLKLYHATWGLLVYLLSTATVLFGLCSDWFQAQIKGPLWYICFALPLYPALVIMNQVLDIYLPKKKALSKTTSMPKVNQHKFPLM